MEDTQDQPKYDFSRYDHLGLNDLILAMNSAQINKDAIDEVSKKANAEFDYLRLVLVPNKMDEDGVSNLTLDGIGRVGLTADAYVSIKSGMKGEAYRWLEDTGRGSLITPSVNSSSLKAAVKAALVKGEEIPESLFNVTPFTRASITRKGVVS